MSLEVSLQTRPQLKHHDFASTTQLAQKTDLKKPQAPTRSLVLFSPGYHRWILKRWFERSLAWACLIIVSPILLLLALLVRRSSKGAAFLWQERVGLNGRVFHIVKLRSMFEDAEQWTGAVWAQEDDPRVTPLGHYLRKLHLDELPQLWNVARGEMSIIGPRPERPEFIDDLIEQIPGYECRLAVLPGITGLAQINLAPDQSHDCVRRKIELDLEYIFTAEPSLDLRIIACTILKMTGIPRERAAKLCHVFREPTTGSLDNSKLYRIDSPAREIAEITAGKSRILVSECEHNSQVSSGASNDNWLADSSLTVQG